MGYLGLASVRRCLVYRKGWKLFLKSQVSHILELEGQEAKFRMLSGCLHNLCVFVVITGNIKLNHLNHFECTTPYIIIYNVTM